MSELNKQDGKVAKPVPMAGDVLTFTTFSCMFFGNCLGIFGDDSSLTIGVTQLSLAGLFFVCSRPKTNFDYFWGNMNLIFAFFFGVLGGVTNTLTGLGIELNPYVVATPTMVAGVLLCLTIPATKGDPWTYFLLYVCAAVAVLFMGLGGYGVMAGTLIPIAGVLLGVVALIGLYAVTSTFFGYVGINLPLGKPLFPRKSTVSEHNEAVPEAEEIVVT